MVIYELVNELFFLIFIEENFNYLLNKYLFFVCLKVS